MIEKNGVDIRDVGRMRKAGILPGAIPSIRVKLPREVGINPKISVKKLSCFVQGIPDEQACLTWEDKDDPFSDEYIEDEHAHDSLKGCLWDFILLHDKPNEEVRLFVQRWGKLEEEITETEPREYKQPIWIYKRDAGHVRDILLLAAGIRLNTINKDNLLKLGDTIPSQNFLLHCLRTGEKQLTNEQLTCVAQTVLSRCVNNLLVRAKPMPEFTFERGKAELILNAANSYPRLFTRLVFELVGAITAGIYFCGQCQELFTKEQADHKLREDAGRNTYCSKECAQEAHKAVRSNSNKQARKRKKEA